MIGGFARGLLVFPRPKPLLANVADYYFETMSQVISAVLACCVQALVLDHVGSLRLATLAQVAMPLLCSIVKINVRRLLTVESLVKGALFFGSIILQTVALKGVEREAALPLRLITKMVSPLILLAYGPQRSLAAMVLTLLSSAFLMQAVRANVEVGSAATMLLLLASVTCGVILGLEQQRKPAPMIDTFCASALFYFLSGAWAGLLNERDTLTWPVANRAFAYGLASLTASEQVALYSESVNHDPFYVSVVLNTARLTAMAVSMFSTAPKQSVWFIAASSCALLSLIIHKNESQPTVPSANTGGGGVDRNSGADRRGHLSGGDRGRVRRHKR